MGSKRNIFGSGWMKKHVNRNNYNLVKPLRVVVFHTCMDTNEVMSSPCSTP